jgi:uncharacterized protein (TIGR03382 family)
MKKLIITTFGLMAGWSASNAATVFQFNEAFSGGISSNLSNAAGLAATNGLFWGIIIDKDGGSLSRTTFDPIVPTFSSVVALTAGGAATDAIVVFADSFTADQSFGGGFTDVSGTTGTAGGVSAITVNYTNGIVAGQTFQLIWFDSVTKTAGVLSSPEFVVPADAGNVVTVDDVFIGADPIRAATGITFIPEPSTMMLGALGALGLLRRRR